MCSTCSQFVSHKLWLCKTKLCKTGLMVKPNILLDQDRWSPLEGLVYAEIAQRLWVKPMFYNSKRIRRQDTSHLANVECFYCSTWQQARSYLLHSNIAGLLMNFDTDTSQLRWSWLIVSWNHGPHIFQREWYFYHKQ